MPFRGRKPVISILAVIIFVLLLGVLRVYKLQVVGWKGGKPVQVEILTGSSPRDVADLIAGKGIVWNGYLFYWQIRRSGSADRFKAGRYSFRVGQAPASIIDDIASGRFSDKTVTVPEGLTIADTAAALAADIPGFDAAKFVELTADASRYAYPFLESVGSRSLEGYLFPETYAVDKRTDEKTMVTRMLDEFSRKTGDLPWERSTKLGYLHWDRLYNGQKQLRLKDKSIVSFSRNDIVIIASLIEKEARFDDEKAKIAAVIYNRLRNAWRLQIDATVLYARGRHKVRLMYKDLKVESPYNTYLHKGLPPGPICSPGLASIKAALQPADEPYFYYVASGGGRHVFVVTKEEFLKAKAEMKRMRREGML